MWLLRRDDAANCNTWPCPGPGEKSGTSGGGSAAAGLTQRSGRLYFIPDGLGTVAVGSSAVSVQNRISARHDALGAFGDSAEDLREIRTAPLCMRDSRERVVGSRNQFVRLDDAF